MRRASGIAEPDADAEPVPAAQKSAPRIATVRGCGNCEHFHRHDMTMGYCHRYPPTAVVVEVLRMQDGQSQVRTNGAWPPVVPTDICGEWGHRALLDVDDFAALERTEGQA